MIILKKVLMTIACISLVTTLWSWGKKDISPAGQDTLQEKIKSETVQPEEHTVDTNSGRNNNPEPKHQTDILADEQNQGADWLTVTNGSTVVVYGRVRLIGNEPFSQLIITDEAGKDWYIADEDRPRLGNMEQRRVSIQAEVEIRPMILANGKHMGDRRVLKNIVILH